MTNGRHREVVAVACLNSCFARSPQRSGTTPDPGDLYHILRSFPRSSCDLPQACSRARLSQTSKLLGAASPLSANQDWIRSYHGTFANSLAANIGCEYRLLVKAGTQHFRSEFTAEGKSFVVKCYLVVAVQGVRPVRAVDRRYTSALQRLQRMILPLSSPNINFKSRGSVSDRAVGVSNY